MHKNLEESKRERYIKMQNEGERKGERVINKNRERDIFEALKKIKKENVEGN